MAFMIPDDVSSFKTQGEGRVYAFLKSVAKPDDQFISWYSPETEGREPDFILFSHSNGIVALEVKDWDVGQIEEAKQHNIVLRQDNKKKSYTNPLRQAKGYQYDIKSKIEKDGFLVEKNGLHRGKSKIPISHGVIFTNILRHYFIEKGLDQVIDINKVFFSDDLHPESELACDKSGNCFRRIIREKFPPLFPCRISYKELLYLKRLIDPLVIISDPRRDKSESLEKRMHELRVLDNDQESIARKHDGGHRLIKGSSGTGKSILLVHKAIYLRKYNPKIKRILVLCYNLTLSNYLRRLVFDKGVSMGDGGVEVWSFYEFCGHILKEPVDHNIHDESYYHAALEQAMDEAQQQGLVYDAILIDEGQDFTDEMLVFVKQLLNSKTDNLTLVMDENQNIYRRKQSWRNLGFNFAGKRTRVLKYAYRSTAELNTFVKKFLNSSKSLTSEGKTGQMEMFPGYGEFHGPNPFFTQFDSLDEIIAYTIDEIKRLVYTEAIPLNQISIIYTSGYFSDPNSPELIEAVTTALNANGLFYHWVSQDSKRQSPVRGSAITAISADLILVAYCFEALPLIMPLNLTGGS
jgi:hypothetical protein